MAAGLAVAAPALVTLLNFPLQAVTGGRAPCLPYLAAVLVAALYGGWQAGLGALLLSGIAAEALFLPGRGPLLVFDDVSGQAALTLFGIAGCLIILAADQARRRAELGSEARERIEESQRRLHRALRAAEQEIADRVRAEQGLRASEERMRLAMGAMHAIVYEWDRRDESVERSAGLEGLIGYRVEETEPTRGWWRDRVHPDDLRTIDAAAAAVIARREPTFTQEYRVRHRDGRWIWIQTHHQLVYDEAGKVVRVVGCAFDIDARRRAEEAARASDTFVRLVADNAGAMIVYVDAERRYRFVNRAYLEAMALEDRDVLGRTVEDVLGAEIHSRVRERVERALAGENLQVQATIGAGRGRTREVLASYTAHRDDSGAVQGVVITMADISDRVVAERALQEANRRKDEFLATLAHELRNPLAPIRTAAHLLAEPNLSAARREQARAIIARQAQGLTRLVDDLLEVSRLTLGRINLQREALSVATVVEQAVEVAGPLAQARSQVLQVELPEQPVEVLADLTRLSQVLVNLLTNAVKYTPAGGSIALRVAVEDGGVVLRVRDTGIGIPAGMLENVFEMFTQVRRADGTRTGGLGIGLALARRLVEMHGGRIHARSDGEGRGSEFVVWLPLPEAPAQQAAPAAAAPAAARGAGCRVLVVDDNVDAADSLALSLEILGHRVTVAYDGVAGLAAGIAGEFDVALLDIGLPGMDGYALARELRAALRERCPWLVALTGWGQAEDRRRAEEAGFDVHLTKPADPVLIGRMLADVRTSRAA